MRLSRLMPPATAITTILTLAGCASPPPAIPQAQLFAGLNDFSRPTSTDSPVARRYFNQGLAWAYAFNHEEAERSFRRAAELDPEFALAWWGVALVQGPHINFPAMTPERTQAAWDALQRARTLAPSAPPVERALIEALAARYADPDHAPTDRRPLDEAYAAAMSRVYAAFPTDPDVAALYSESLMDLQPWDLWTRDGVAKGNTTEIVQVLDHALTLDPDHLGAAHLMIHACEAGPEPERALAAADVLRSRTPISGHLLHMPSHIDVQTGRWRHAADQNIAAIAADARYRRLVPKQGFWTIYMAHNAHFLTFVNMMRGDESAARGAALTTLRTIPADYALANAPFVDAYHAIHNEVLMRFGRWEEILRAAPPASTFPIAGALHAYARGVAYAALGRIDAANAELAGFQAAVTRVPHDAAVNFNSAHTILRIAEFKLRGEIALAQGRPQDAIANLEQGVALEDTLSYMEPPDWMTPLRHTLGAVQLVAGDAAAAAETYRQDLQIWPENGWSLLGLEQALAAQGRLDEAGAVRVRLNRVWAGATPDLRTSCACVKPLSARTP